MLANHGARIGATETALLVTDFSAAREHDREPRDLLPLVERLAAQAAASGQASASRCVAGQPYQVVLVPVKAPVVVGWVLMAFPLDQQLVDRHEEPVGARPDAAHARRRGASPGR